MERLLTIAQRIAEKKHDGHLTIMRFTAGWKAMFGTPDLDSGNGRKEVENLVRHETLDEALFHLILNAMERL